MFRIITNPIKISGSQFEKKAKTILIIISACIYSALLYFIYVKNEIQTIYFYAFLLIGLEIVIVAILGNIIHWFFRIIPLLSFTTFSVLCLFEFHKSPTTKSGYFYAAYYITFLCVLIKCLIDTYYYLKKQGKGTNENPHMAISVPLVSFISVDLILSIVSQIINQNENVFIELATRLFLYFSLSLLAFPNDTLINIKRILRLFVIFLWIALLCFILCLIITTSLSKHISAKYALIMCLIPSIAFLAIACVCHKMYSYYKQGIFRCILSQQYIYEDKENETVKINNNLILDSALDRNYLLEYSCRMINVPTQIKEIATIQSRIETIKCQRNSRNENEAIRLLGELNDKYEFKNGLSNYRMNSANI